MEGGSRFESQKTKSDYSAGGAINASLEGSFNVKSLSSVGDEFVKISTAEFVPNYDRSVHSRGSFQNRSYIE